jgi:3-methyladenine DNA glycosylase AlkD
MKEVNEILNRLRSLGNESVRKHNVKFGAGENQFGVKMGDIRTIAAELKMQPELGWELWKTGNLESQLLAILLFQPKKLSQVQLEELAETISYFHVSDWFASYLLKNHPSKISLGEKWMNHPHVWKHRLSWSILAGRLAKKDPTLQAAHWLSIIEEKLATSPFEIQWTMNSALANIGIYWENYRAEALRIGEKLGVYRDYPVSKGCTSPFAPIWINAMVSRFNEKG